MKLGCVNLRYFRAHCCSKFARTAHVKLTAKLTNQSELTQIPNVGGVNGGGDKGKEKSDRFEPVSA